MPTAPPKLKSATSHIRIRPAARNLAMLDEVVRRVRAGGMPKAFGFDEFPVFQHDPLHNAHLLLNAYLKQAHGYLGADCVGVAAARKIVALPAPARADVVRAALARVAWWFACDVRDVRGRWGRQELVPRTNLAPLLGRLYARKTPLADGDLVALCAFAAGKPYFEDAWHDLNLTALMPVIAKRLAAGPPPAPRPAAALTAALRRLRRLWAAEVRALPFARNEKPLRRVEEVLAAAEK